MARVVYENMLAESNPNASANREIRDELSRIVKALDITLPSTIVQYKKTKENAASLSPGFHKLPDTEVTDTRLLSLGQVFVKNNVEFNRGNQFVSNIDFTGTVTLNALSVIIFTNCRFTKIITMKSGAKAVFNSCVFQSASAINNAGGATNAQTVGCARTSGVSHTNTTDTAEIT